MKKKNLKSSDGSDCGNVSPWAGRTIVLKEEVGQRTVQNKTLKYSVVNISRHMSDFCYAALVLTGLMSNFVCTVKSSLKQMNPDCLKKKILTFS